MEKRIGANVVTKSPVYGGGFVYTAWEPSNAFGPHHTITYMDDGACFGDISARRIGAEIERMKGGSPERIAACDAHRMLGNAIAYSVIVSAFPEAGEGFHDNGRIRT